MADEKKKATTGPQPRAIVDTSIIDPKRMEELRASAKTKVDKERKAAAEAKLLEQFTKEERLAGGLDEPMVTVLLDFAPYADKAILDGVVYFAGQTRTVPESVAAVLHEMMSQTWKHQSEIDGKSENFYRKARSLQAAASGGVSSHILRA